jgi:dTDP-4-dehydrorhamnose 3,5-epimerase
MIFTPTAISDVVRITGEPRADDRGLFLETYRADEFARAGLSATFVQDNLSRSRMGVLRGLHYQLRAPQGKLVRVVRGEVFDAAVDLRSSSPTFGRWVGECLSADNHQMLWIPPGFAHGFYVLSEAAEVLYKVTEYFDAESDRTLIWDDPRVAIAWPLLDGRPPVLSAKDARGRRFDELEPFA